jgi:BirA family transcriptional regulator, biotin operon repressor / biotin---[acetyl-CoA-carboxylase] ligase
MNSATSASMLEAAPETAGLPQPDWLRWVESCGSTNTWAIEHRMQLQHGDVVFTRQQTAGRGQRGRVWCAPPGVITASFVLDCVSVQLSGLSLAAGLAVIYAVEDLMPNLTGIMQLKWPNDVLIQNRKVAGVLCESSQTVLAQTSQRVVVGIGLNRWADFTQELIQDLEEPPFGSPQPRPDGSSPVLPISLHDVSAVVPKELLLLERMRHYLLQVANLLTHSNRFSQPLGLTRLLPQIHSRDVLLGREVCLELDREVVRGRSVGISASGRLLLRLPNNEMGAFTSGRVRWT